MKKILISSISLIIVAAVFWFYSQKKNSDATTQSFRFVEVSRGDIETVISCTGTLSAVGTVEIGTQVSGTLARVYVDFNDQVSRGQLLAVLDTTVLKSSLIAAQADIAQVNAQFDKAVADYNRNLPLKEKGYLSVAEWLPYQTALETSKAALASSRAQLERAQQNLDYAYIQSPIDGTIIQRNIEQGQTVAANFSAPTLFIIAEDLSRMEIHALVDESDIGSIHVGQNVRFSVPAYYGKSFDGIVRQVRLQPETVQNVVNYTAIIDAVNRDNMLLPGMTATVDFIVDQRANVLLVANSALSFQPTADMFDQLGKKPYKQNRPPAPPDSLRSLPRSENRKALWLLDENGSLRMKRVTTGISDGKQTELLAESDVESGERVISGTNGTSKSTKNQSVRMGPPPMF